MSMLWQEEEFKQICSRDSLSEKAIDIEKTIGVKEHERAHYERPHVQAWLSWSERGTVNP